MKANEDGTRFNVPIVISFGRTLQGVLVKLLFASTAKLRDGRELKNCQSLFQDADRLLPDLLLLRLGSRPELGGSGGVSFVVG